MSYALNSFNTYGNPSQNARSSGRFNGQSNANWGYNPGNSQPFYNNRYSNPSFGGNGNGYGNLGQDSQSLMWMLMGALQSIFGQLGTINQKLDGNTNADWGYGSDCPTHPAPPVCPPPPPVCQPEQKLLGSAGLFGDPQFGVFTPGLNNVPDGLKGFDSGIQKGQTVTLLKDTDLGGLEVSGTGVQVNPNNANSIGIGSATFKSGTDVVILQGDGRLLVNGQNKGNINNAGTIAPITLANGLTVSTGQAIDDANGNTKERFIISNGEYKITAAARKPHADAKGYLDMNFEELAGNAADNATGFQASVPGLTQKFGIGDLLKLEPNSTVLSA
jgi:hypothetical protein